MLFNSYVYILAFLPISLIIYWLLVRLHWVTMAKLWLVAASFYFYGWWDVRYVPLLAGSVLFNYLVGVWLANRAATSEDTSDEGAVRENKADHTSDEGSVRENKADRTSDEGAVQGKRNRWDEHHRADERHHADNRRPGKSVLTRRLILTFGVATNVALLGYFKYMDFFLDNLNHLLGTEWSLLGLVLPIGISFYTFTQIAYLSDAYKGEVRENSLLNYSLFVTFFPQLIAGPILHHREMMPQFADRRTFRPNSHHFALGLTVFIAGLVKKVVIADTLAPIATYGFDEAVQLSFVEAWITSLSYTFQLYFDFSGYTDMAIGATLLFNIKLPLNFDSPYKSLNIQVFWRRWHMTLGRFLQKYVYIPLGGNRKGSARTYLNLMITFLIGGLWHGAGWTFIFWGFLHGAALVIHRIWMKLNIRMPKLLAWFITFQFVNASWVFFRATEWSDAIKVLRGMVNVESIGLTAVSPSSLLLVAAVFVLAVAFRNTNELQERFRPGFVMAGAVAAGAVFALIQMNRVSEFLYFNF